MAGHSAMQCTARDWQHVTDIISLHQSITSDLHTIMHWEQKYLVYYANKCFWDESIWKIYRLVLNLNSLAGNFAVAKPVANLRWMNCVAMRDREFRAELQTCHSGSAQRLFPGPCLDELLNGTALCPNPTRVQWLRASILLEEWTTHIQYPKVFVWPHQDYC